MSCLRLEGCAIRQPPEENPRVVRRPAGGPALAAAGIAAAVWRFGCRRAILAQRESRMDCA